MNQGKIFMKKIVSILVFAVITNMAMDEQNGSLLSQFEALVNNRIDRSLSAEGQLHEALHATLDAACEAGRISNFNREHLLVIDCCGAAIAAEFILSGANVCEQLIILDDNLSEKFPALHTVMLVGDDLRHVLSLDLLDDEQRQEASLWRHIAIKALSRARENGRLLSICRAD